MKRRQLFRIAAGGLASLTLPVLAQQARRVRRIGFLGGESLQSNAARLVAFRAGMSELGWVDGRDYVIDARYTFGDAQAAAKLATELVASAPDLLLVPGDLAVVALAERTRTIPIVFASAQDPMSSGQVASLQRPGGNVTGLTNLGRELSAKRLQLLKEAFPRVNHVVFMTETLNVGSTLAEKDVVEAAPRLGIRVTTIRLRQAADIEQAFKRGAAIGAQAYLFAPGGLIGAQSQSIADRARQFKAPVMGASIVFAEAGGLMAYTVSNLVSFRRAALYVDKIFKGANPGDLPIEQPTKFEFVVNMKTAKAMGITLPQSILLQADRLIE